MSDQPPETVDQLVEEKRERDKRARQLLGQRIEDLQWLMRHQQGRRIVATLLFDDCDFGLAPTDARASGRLEVAEVWWTLITTYSRAEFALMFTERA